MDVHVFYFHEGKQQVVRSCIGSHFLGHADAEETFQSIQAVHGKLDLPHNLLQISMDGPNMNWKTVEVITEYREHNDPGGSLCTMTLVESYRLGFRYFVEGN